MLIWWGPKYLFKTNMKKRMETCSFCGQNTAISSFDAYHFFSLYSIPLIPLGKKHISNKCYLCDKHYRISMKEWTALQEKNIAEAKMNYSQKRTDAKIAIETHNIYDVFGTDVETQEFSQNLEKDFPNNDQVITHLAEWYTATGNTEKANSLIRKALVLNPQNETARRYSAQFYYSDKNYALAKEEICKIQTYNETTDYKLLLNLAIDFLNQKQFNDSYMLFQLLLNKIPAKASKDYRVLTSVKKLEKALGISVSALRNNTTMSKDRRTFLIIAAAGVAIALLVNYYFTSSQTLYVTNNSVSKAEVSLSNGKTTSVNPGEFKIIDMAEGNYTAAVKLENGLEYKTNLKIENTILQRFTVSSIYVLNINRCSILLWEKLIYTSKKTPDPNDKNDFKINIGKDYEVFRDVDYPFMDAPETISLDKHSSTETKYRVSVFNTNLPDDVRMLLDKENKVNETDIIPYIEGQLSGGVKDKGLVDFYTYLCSKNELKDRSSNFIKTLLK